MRGAYVMFLNHLRQNFLVWTELLWIREQPLWAHSLFFSRNVLNQPSLIWHLFWFRLLKKSSLVLLWLVSLRSGNNRILPFQIFLLWNTGLYKRRYCVPVIFRNNSFVRILFFLFLAWCMFASLGRTLWNTRSGPGLCSTEAPVWRIQQWLIVRVRSNHQ